MKLKLKSEYENTTVQRGKFSMNTYNIVTAHFLSFYNNGFADCFEVEEDKFKEAAKKAVPYKGVDQTGAFEK